VAVLIGLVHTPSMRSEIDRGLPKAMELAVLDLQLTKISVTGICRTFAIRPSSDRTAAARGPFLSPRAARRAPSELDEAPSAISAHAVQSPDWRASVSLA
jgi:hypothetical protein